jgi:hypothetical protein
VYVYIYYVVVPPFPSFPSPPPKKTKHEIVLCLSFIFYSQIKKYTIKKEVNGGGGKGKEAQ